MSELSGALGGSAPKHNLICGDKTYPVSLITQGVMVAYEKALYERARVALRAIRGDVDKDYYERRMDALTDKFEDGAFSIKSELGQKALQKPGGSVLLFQLLLGKIDPTTHEVVPLPEWETIGVISQAPEEAGAVLRTVMKESFPGVDIDKLEAEAAGPKVRVPAASPSG